MKITITILFILGIGVPLGYTYRQLQIVEHGTVKERELTYQIEKQRSIYEYSRKEMRDDMIDDMLARLSLLEGKNDALDSDGQLNYGNDPVERNYTACKQIGGWRKSECDTWTKYRWSIATAQHFYQKLYGESITEKEMLIKLLDDEFVDTFTAQAILEVPGAIWHWHGAKRDKEYFDTVIPIIRDLID